MPEVEGIEDTTGRGDDVAMDEEGDTGKDAAVIEVGGGALERSQSMPAHAAPA